MTASHPTNAPRPNRSRGGSLRCGLYRITPEGPTRADLIAPGEELILWVEVRAGDRPRELAIEFWRGDRLRDAWRQRLEEEAEASLAFRLHWNGAGGSSRLTCRVRIDGREMARRTALLGPGTVDAQGRFTEGADAQAASPRTLLAFADAFQRQLDPDAKGRGKESAPDP